MASKSNFDNSAYGDLSEGISQAFSGKNMLDNGFSDLSKSNLTIDSHIREKIGKAVRVEESVGMMVKLAYMKKQDSKDGVNFTFTNFVEAKVNYKKIRFMIMEGNGQYAVDKFCRDIDVVSCFWLLKI